MMADQPELRKQFEQKLASEIQQFAADPRARLQWWFRAVEISTGGLRKVPDCACLGEKPGSAKLWSFKALAGALSAYFCPYKQPQLNAAQDQKSRVEGQVLSHGRGAPLKKVPAVRSSGVEIEPIQLRELRRADRSGGGKFVFEDVTPGEPIFCPPSELDIYAATTEQDRRLAGATQIKLDGGQENEKTPLIKLTPQGMIFGKVVDEDGDPISTPH